MLKKTLELCKQHNTEIILVVTPMPEVFNSLYSNLDKIYSPYYQLAEEYNACLLDFNLKKDKSDMYSDKIDFCNTTHMSGDGAVKFSYDLADILNRMDNGENIQKLFYGSYEQISVLQ